MEDVFLELDEKMMIQHYKKESTMGVKKEKRALYKRLRQLCSGETTYSNDYPVIIVGEFPPENNVELLEVLERLYDIYDQEMYVFFKGSEEPYLQPVPVEIPNPQYFRFKYIDDVTRQFTDQGIPVIHHKELEHEPLDDREPIGWASGKGVYNGTTDNTDDQIRDQRMTDRINRIEKRFHQMQLEKNRTLKQRMELKWWNYQFSFNQWLTDKLPRFIAQRLPHSVQLWALSIIAAKTIHGDQHPDTLTYSQMFSRYDE
jgi:hypothetical protein